MSVCFVGGWDAYVGVHACAQVCVCMYVRVCVCMCVRITWPLRQPHFSQNVVMHSQHKSMYC